MRRTLPGELLHVKKEGIAAARYLLYNPITLNGFMARQRGFGLVQINTNGLRLSREAGYARTLREAGLDSVYLQWDAASEKGFRPLRGLDCLDFKRRAVRHCAEAGLGVVLVATLVRGVNDGEVGDLLRLALDLGPAVRGLHMAAALYLCSAALGKSWKSSPRIRRPARPFWGVLSGHACWKTASRAKSIRNRPCWPKRLLSGVAALRVGMPRERRRVAGAPRRAAAQP